MKLVCSSLIAAVMGLLVSAAQAEVVSGVIAQDEYYQLGGYVSGGWMVPER